MELFDIISEVAINQGWVFTDRYGGALKSYYHDPANNQFYMVDWDAASITSVYEGETHKDFKPVRESSGKMFNQLSGLVSRMGLEFTMRYGNDEVAYYRDPKFNRYFAVNWGYATITSVYKWETHEPFNPERSDVIDVEHN